MKDKIYFLEFIKITAPYKWLIFSTALFSLILTAVYLYFQPSIYISSALIKIKSDTQHRINQDPLSNALAITGTRGVDQELAILKTFYTNNKAINKLNLEVQYFKKEGYKKIEYFLNPPIEIENITILNKDIIGKEIVLHPIKDGFQLKQNGILGQREYQYREWVKTKNFKFIVKKNSNFNHDIYFKLNGDNRKIYENIVKQNLKVSKLNDKVSLIQVSYEDTSPVRAKIYVDALIDAYIKQSITDKSKKSNKILDFINGQLEIIGKKLEESEDKLERYRVFNNVIEPSVQSTSILERLSRIEIELYENRVKKRLLRKITPLIKKDNYLESITPILRELNDDSTIRVIEQLRDLEDRANQLSTEFTEKYPELRAIRENIRKKRHIISLNITNIKSAVESKYKNLLSLKREYEKELKSLPTKEKQLIHLRRSYEVNSNMYSYLLEKKSENEMKRVATISDYEIIDRAYSNGIPIRPKRNIVLLIGLILGLILGISIAYIHSILTGRLE